MISQEQADDLEALTTQIHAQILHDHGSCADAPTQLAQQALHNLIISQCNGEDRSLHGRVNFPAFTGFGKSTACVAFIIASYQLHLLGNGVSLTYAAARVGQLFDFEGMLREEGFPESDLRKYVSILHGSKVNGLDVKRASDTATDAPILLISHERIKKVYRRKEGWTDGSLVYFNKYRDQERDVLLWDERCTTTRPSTVRLCSLKQAIAGLAVVFGEQSSRQPIIEWLLASEKVIESEVASHAARGVQAHQGALTSLLCLDDLQEHYDTLTHKSYGLMRENRECLMEFIEALRFQPRVVAPAGTSSGGLISYDVVVPDNITRCVNLDASHGISELAQASARTEAGLLDAEQHCPMLKEMRVRYGKRLQDLKDCSDHTFIHWQRGAGKDAVERDTAAYLDGTATGGNIILEVVDVVKEYVEQKVPVILWTHKSSSRTRLDLGEQLKACLRKAGIDLQGKPFEDASVKVNSPARFQPLVVVDTYGQHDAVNCYSYTQVAIHVGIQERSALDLSAALAAESRNKMRAISKADISKVKVTEKAIVLVQATGRSCSRKVKNGKSQKQITWAIYLDIKEENLTATLRPWWNGAKWEKFKPKYATDKPVKIIETWTLTVKEYLDTLPVTQASIGSKTLKAAIHAEEVAPTTWKYIMQALSDDETLCWVKLGGSLARMFPES